MQRDEEHLRPFCVLTPNGSMPPQSRSLPIRFRLLVIVSALYATRNRAKAFLYIKRTLRQRRLPASFFSELFIHLSLFLGYPAMLDGLERLASLRANKSRKNAFRRKRGVAIAEGRSILTMIYGEQTGKLVIGLEKLEKGLALRITEDAYGTIMARQGLHLSEREVINVVVLFIEGYKRQLYSHLRGALRVGVKPRTLKSLLALVGQLVNQDARPAMETVDRIWQNRRCGSF
jgi:4-carboxymuconolactone decarboxylase